MSKPLAVFAYIDDEGCEVEVPAKYYICDTCDGHGKHSHAIDGNGITASEWAEWDCEEQESYMRGDYDRQCETCNGSGKTVDIDWDLLTSEQITKIEEYRKELAMLHAIEAAERRMGA